MGSMKMRTGEKAGAMKKQHKLLHLTGLLALLVIIGISGMHVRAALENEKSSQTRSVQMQDSQIPEATLVIGSHLIHINGMTDEIYAAAMDSANEFNQYQMYYKSELADGAWFEISEASSIADIVTSGSPVSKSVIEALEFTHMTDENGSTTDLRTGQKVSVFDINTPYDLNALEELEPIRIQYQILREKIDKNESDEIYLDMIQEFFSKDIKTELTKECDSSLSGLEAYKEGLPAREKPSMWTEKTEEIMVSVDAERRVLSLTILSEYLDALEERASGIAAKEEESTESEDEEEAVPPDFIVNSDIVAAIGDAIQNVETSINTYEAKRLTESVETASAKLEYRYSQDFIEKARAHDTSGCDELMERLCDMQNILEGVIADQDSELATLAADLVSTAFQNYAADLRAGASPAYVGAQSEGASQAVLSKHLTEQKTIANADRLEYQTLLEAQFQRMENKRAQQYVLQLIDGVDQLERSVLPDAAEIYLKETIAEYLAWLRNEYAELVKQSADGSELSQKEEQKAELLKKKQDAQDRNDLKEAKKQNAKMEAMQKEIDALLAKLNAVLSSPNSSEADKAQARAAMGNSSAAAQLSQMAAKLASDIRSGTADANDLQNQLAALSAAAQLDPEAGANALDEVMGALEQATGLDEAVAAQLKAATTDALSAAASAQNAASLKTEEALLARLDEILTELLGTEYENAQTMQRSAAILALEWYGQNQTNDAALSTAAVLTRQEAQKENAYIYTQYKDQKTPYMSLQALGKVLGYRYIFDDKHNTATLQKAKEYYLFTLGKKQCRMAGEVRQNLTAEPKLLTALYIHGSDSIQIFDAKAEYIKRTSYGIVGTAQLETLAKEIYDKLLEGGA